MSDDATPTKGLLFMRAGSEFCVQAVSGVWMALFRMAERQQVENHGQASPAIETLRYIASNVPGSVLETLLIGYLNDCWHSYGKKDDQVVVDLIGKIVATDCMSHVSCIFIFLQQRCFRLLKFSRMIPGNMGASGTGADAVRAVFRLLLEKVDENMCEQSADWEFKCNAGCSPVEYDAEDLFSISKEKH